MATAWWLCVVALLAAGSHALPSRVSFPGPDGVSLTGVLYAPTGFDGCRASSYAAVVLMHGCTGIWSNRQVNATNDDGTPNLQKHIEKWAVKLASENMVALVVESFTPRVPPTLSPQDREWQNHCSGNKYAGRVDPYTTRVHDARAGWEYLASLGAINPKKIGLLGWSHGGESSMVEAAATPRHVNRERPESDYRFAALVSFYPGCGSYLGFMDRFGGNSFWRPYQEFQLNVGEQDAFYANCKTRTDIAIRDYGSIINFPAFPEAHHTFDGEQEAWPTEKCEITAGDFCTMSAADIDSLAFLKRYLSTGESQI
ncbi:hypothetical protein Mapa_005806 [Marchantia paleacea]|nr:hypothetical protein Mapa_005806 [Marchantia paleacea]